MGWILVVLAVVGPRRGLLHAVPPVVVEICRAVLRAVLGRRWVCVLPALLSAVVRQLLDDFDEVGEQLLAHLNGGAHHALLQAILDRRGILREANLLLVSSNHELLLLPSGILDLLLQIFPPIFSIPIVGDSGWGGRDQLLQPFHPILEGVAVGVSTAFEHVLVAVLLEGFVGAVHLVGARQLLDVAAEVVLHGVAGGELPGVRELRLPTFG